MAHLDAAGAGRQTTTPDADNVTQPAEPEWMQRGFGGHERWLSAGAGLAMLAVWESAVWAGWISRLFFPPPSLILQTLVAMIVSGKLWSDLEITLFRLGLGVVCGAGLGLLCGLLMGMNRPLRIVLDPIVAALHPLPKLALLPIFLVLLGIGEASKVALIGMVAFFPMMINTLAGVRQIDAIYWEAAANYGAPPRALLWRVILPGSLPMAMAGLRLAMNSALIVTIAVEMLTAHRGLGATIWLSWQTLRTSELYAILVVIGLMGLLVNALLEYSSQRLMPWLRKDASV